MYIGERNLDYNLKNLGITVRIGTPLEQFFKPPTVSFNLGISNATVDRIEKRIEAHAVFSPEPTPLVCAALIFCMHAPTYFCFALPQGIWQQVRRLLIKKEEEEVAW